MNLLTIPAHVPFLDAIAAEWLAASAGRGPMAAADGLILLPTRRAARALAEAFLRASDGRALLLPRITALGGAGRGAAGLGRARSICRRRSSRRGVWRRCRG